MFCTHCGTQSEQESKFCTHCGKALSRDTNTDDATSVDHQPAMPAKKSRFNTGNIVGALVILAVLGIGAYNSRDEEAIDTNNEALSSFDAGDSETAIRQFEEALESAHTNDTKINTLKNLAYVYSAEGQYDLALNTFEEVLTYAKEESFDYYLIAGEIAELEGKPNAAHLNYNKAYQMNPNDAQINTSLALFYLDVEDIFPNYIDYPKALSYAQRAYDLDPDKTETSKQNLAIAHFFNENFDQTIVLMSSSNLDQHPYVSYWLGLAYALSGDDMNGQFYLQKAVDASIEMEQEVYDYLYSL